MAPTVAAATAVFVLKGKPVSSTPAAAIPALVIAAQETQFALTVGAANPAVMARSAGTTAAAGHVEPVHGPAAPTLRQPIARELPA